MQSCLLCVCVNQNQWFPFALSWKSFSLNSSWEHWSMIFFSFLCVCCTVPLEHKHWCKQSSSTRCERKTDTDTVFPCCCYKLLACFMLTQILSWVSWSSVFKHTVYLCFGASVLNCSADFMSQIQSLKETQILYFHVDFANCFVFTFSQILSSSLFYFMLITNTNSDQCWTLASYRYCEVFCCLPVLCKSLCSLLLLNKKQCVIPVMCCVRLMNADVCSDAAGVRPLRLHYHSLCLASAFILVLVTVIRLQYHRRVLKK